MTIIAATGHRPDKLGGYGPHVLGKTIPIALKYLRDPPTVGKTEVKGVISGMALGWDTAVALAATSLQIPLTCAIIEGMEKRWPAADQRLYKNILKLAADVVAIPEPIWGSYATA